MVALKIDWLSVTFPAEFVEGCQEFGRLEPWRLLDEICLPVRKIETFGKGFQGWKHVASLDGIKGTKLAWGGQRNTVHLSLSASALTFYEETRFFDVVGFVEHVLGLGARVTRLDLALDDKDERVTLERILTARESGHIITRLKFDVPHGIGVLDHDGTKPWTLNWGSRKGGGNVVRIYNKAAEQELDGFWVRVEAELHGDKADQVTHDLVKRGWTGKVAAGVVRGLLDFRDSACGLKDKTSWPMLPWWRDFLGECEVLKFGTAASPDRTVEDDFRYLVNQVSRPFVRAFSVYGEDVITAMVKVGAARLTEEDHIAIELSQTRNAALCPPERDPEAQQAASRAVDEKERNEALAILKRRLQERDWLNQLYEALALEQGSAA